MLLIIYSNQARLKQNNYKNKGNKKKFRRFKL